VPAAGDSADGEAAKLTFNVPTWRGDIAIEEDLVEEVARHYGYDKIGDELPAGAAVGEHRAHDERRRAARHALTAAGFDEAVSFSFIDAAHDGQFELIPGLVAPPQGADGVAMAAAANGLTGTSPAADDQSDARGDAAAFVTLTNPIIEGASRMRATLLPGLLAAVRHNFNHGTRDVRLFEAGRVFASPRVAGERPVEVEALALVATGGAAEAGRAAAPRELDFYDLKGALEAAADAMNLPPLEVAAADARHLRAGQSAAVTLGGREVGWIGRLGEETSTGYKFRQPVFVAEVSLTALLEAEAPPVRYAPLARFPGVVRDASLVVGRRSTFAEMRSVVVGMNLENVRGVELVYVYEGERVPEGKRSVTLRVEYRAPDRTLRDEEADALHQQIVVALEEKFGAQLR
jgi:phenylalanyl-tRNA synthetase beta chain